MYEKVEKPKENKSRAVANSVSQKKDNGKQGVGFVDNRPRVSNKIAERAIGTGPIRQLMSTDVSVFAKSSKKNDKKFNIRKGFEYEVNENDYVITRNPITHEIENGVSTNERWDWIPNANSKDSVWWMQAGTEMSGVEPIKDGVSKGHVTLALEEESDGTMNSADFITKITTLPWTKLCNYKKNENQETVPDLGDYRETHF